jgi:hypothetical protein
MATFLFSCATTTTPGGCMDTLPSHVRPFVYHDCTLQRLCRAYHESKDQQLIEPIVERLHEICQRLQQAVFEGDKVSRNVFSDFFRRTVTGPAAQLRQSLVRAVDICHMMNNVLSTTEAAKETPLKLPQDWFEKDDDIVVGWLHHHAPLFLPDSMTTKKRKRSTTTTVEEEEPPKNRLKTEEEEEDDDESELLLDTSTLPTPSLLNMKGQQASTCRRSARIASRQIQKMRPVPHLAWGAPYNVIAFSAPYDPRKDCHKKRDDAVYALQGNVVKETEKDLHIRLGVSGQHLLFPGMHDIVRFPKDQITVERWFCHEVPQTPKDVYNLVADENKIKEREFVTLAEPDEIQNKAVKMCLATFESLAQYQASLDNMESKLGRGECRHLDQWAGTTTTTTFAGFFPRDTRSSSPSGIIMKDYSLERGRVQWLVPTSLVLPVWRLFSDEGYVVRQRMYVCRKLAIVLRKKAQLEQDASSLVDACLSHRLPEPLPEDLAWWKDVFICGGDDANNKDDETRLCQQVEHLPQPLRSYVIRHIVQRGLSPRHYNQEWLEVKGDQLLYDRGPKLTPTQYRQLADAYYWTYIHDPPQPEYKMVIDFYRQHGMDIYLKKPYLRSGEHRGRSSRSGKLRVMRGVRATIYNKLPSVHVAKTETGDLVAKRPLGPIPISDPTLTRSRGLRTFFDE